MMTTETHPHLSIRRLGERDAGAVVKLAELDSSLVPAAPLLGIEVQGRLLAAVSLRDGASIADPFSRTAELRAMLELRATQLRERMHERRAHASGAPPEAAAAASALATGDRVLSPHPRAS
jgi:hypothetical protein